MPEPKDHHAAQVGRSIWFLGQRVCSVAKKPIPGLQTIALNQKNQLDAEERMPLTNRYPHGEGQKPCT